MLNLLFRIFLVVAGLVALVAVIGSLLPRDFQTSATVRIEATPEQIFPFVNDLLMWQTWSPWNAHDNPDLEVQLGAQTTGKGATQTWTEPRGQGKLWITAVEPNQSVSFSSTFAYFPRLDGVIRLEPDGDATMVTWSSEGSLPGGPQYGWLSMIFESAFRSQCASALQKLKSTVERNIRREEAGEAATQNGAETAAPGANGVVPAGGGADDKDL